VLDAKAYEKLSRWIISEFPTPTTPNVTDTLTMRLLQRLSASLLFAEYPSAAEAPPDLHEFWRKVEFSIETLQDLEKNTRDSRRGDWSPTSFKRGKTVPGRSRADPFSSDDRGVNVPTTAAEACEIRTRVLSELQGILEVCGSELVSCT
jgi:hypothetical protein